MTKQEYFSTQCSPSAQKMIKAMWIMVAALAGVVLLYVINAVASVSTMDQMINMVMEQVDEATMESFEEIEKTLGFTLVQFVTTIVKGTLVYMVSVSVISILLALLACWKKSLGASIVMLVLNAIPIAAGGIFLLGVSIALVVLTSKLNGEYKNFVNAGPRPEQPPQYPQY